MGEWDMYYFIVNTRSRTGKAKLIWNEVKEELKERGIAYEAYITQHKGHATELAEEITSGTSETVSLIIVGGDGTANEVFNGITDFARTKVGLIPTGSGNDLGRGLGITGTPKEQLLQILDSDTVRKVDLGCVSWNHGREKRIFAISSGIGLDAEVCWKALTAPVKKLLNAIHLGNLTYVLLTIETLFTMKTTSAKAILDEGQIVEMNKMICSVAMNLPYEGGGVAMAPHADCEDGKLSMCCISGIPKWRTFLCLPALVSGKHAGITGFTMTDSREMEIELERAMIVHADGEYCGEHRQLHYSCLPQLLQLIW